MSSDSSAKPLADAAPSTDTEILALVDEYGRTSYEVGASDMWPGFDPGRRYKNEERDEAKHELVAAIQRLRSHGGAEDQVDDLELGALYHVVPRSRYDACNQDWLDEKAKGEGVAARARVWIATLQAALRSAEARLDQPVYNRTENAGTQTANILRADIASALAAIRAGLEYEPSDSSTTKETKHGL